MKGSMLDTKQLIPVTMVTSWWERVLGSVCILDLGQASCQCARRVS